MSTTTAGRASRMLSSGMRLWPPARILLSSGCSPRMATASWSDVGSKYSNRAGFIVSLTSTGRASHFRARSSKMQYTERYSAHETSALVLQTRPEETDREGRTVHPTYLELRDVVKRFGRVTAVDRVSFDVKQGEVLTLL